MKRFFRIVRRTLLVMTTLLVALVILTAATPQGRTAFRTLLFLPQILPEFPIKPQEWVIGDPERHTIEFPLAHGTASADLYVPPGQGKHPAVLFFLGVVPPDRDESRVVGLAEGLARAGIVVMIPWLDSQTQNRISPQDVDSLARAFQYLRAHESVDSDRVGMGGICTGASLATVAARDERIRDDVKLVNFFAGYYNAVDMVRAIGSRSRFYEGASAPWKPDGLTLRVFTNHMIEGVNDPNDRKLLARIFVEKAPWTEDEVGSLSMEGTAVYRLLEGVPEDEVDSLISQLPRSTMEFLTMISPSAHLDGLKARVLIMHDRADKLVPSEESRRFADALGDDAGTYHTEFSSFQREIQVHVDESEGVGLLGSVRDAFKLYMHMYNVLRGLS